MRSYDPADSDAWGALRRVRPHRDPMDRPTAMDAVASASENLWHVGQGVPIDGTGADI